MPTVIPTIDRPNVTAQPVRAPSQPTPSPDAFGARMGEAVQALGQVAGDIAQRERARADYAAETDAQNQVDSYYNTEIAPAIQKAKGKNALKLQDEVIPKLRAKMDEVYNGLGSEDQKLGFDRWRKNYLIDQERSLTAHVTREMDTHETETYNSFLNNSVNAAAAKAVNGDIAGIASELNQQEDKILTRGRLNGDDPEKTKALVAKMATDTHLAVINNLLAFDRYKPAKAYFEANKGNIEGTRLDLAKNALDAWKQSHDNRSNAILTRSVNDAVTVLEAGELPPQLDTLKTLTAPDPELSYKLNTAIEDREISGKVYQMTPSEQKANISVLYKPTVSKRELELRTRLEKIHADTVQLLAKEPAALFRKNKLTPVLPIDVEAPETFIQRKNVRDKALSKYGVKTHGLEVKEIDGITLRLNQNNTDQNMGYLNRLRQNTDDEQYELILSDAAKGRADLMIAGGMVTDNPRMADSILRGREIAKANPKAIPDPNGPEVMTAMDAYIGAALPAGVKSQIAEAALYAELHARGSDVDAYSDGKMVALGFDSVKYEEILQNMTGGVFEFNDKKTLSPVYGMDEDDFDDMMDRISDSDLVGAHTVDPVLGTGAPFSAKRLRAVGTLTYVRDGVYWIETGDGVVWGRDNQPFELNLKALYPKLINSKTPGEFLR